MSTAGCRTPSMLLYRFLILEPSSMVEFIFDGKKAWMVTHWKLKRATKAHGFGFFFFGTLLLILTKYA